MRGVDGGEICKQLKLNPQTKYIPIILLSGNHDIEKVSRECGADDCLSKPFDKEMAERKFSRFLDG
jgi:CheY-like chemotaxis protein